MLAAAKLPCLLESPIRVTTGRVLTSAMEATSAFIGDFIAVSD